MNLYIKSLFVIGLSALISACGEVSYKPGASVRDVENAHKACRGVSEAEFSACLQKQGWETPKFDDSDLFAEVSITDNRGAAPTRAEQSVFLEVEQPNKPESTEPTESKSLVAPKTSLAPSLVNPQPSEVSNVTEPITPQPQTPTTDNKNLLTPTPAKLPVDPLKTYKINSWWKFGGTPEHLKRDQAQCEKNLGEAHQANMATQTYTRGLIECLHKNGWKALREMK